MQEASCFFTAFLEKVMKYVDVLGKNGWKVRFNGQGVL
jgi:hypothetical protein